MVQLVKEAETTKINKTFFYLPEEGKRIKLFLAEFTNLETISHIM